LRRLGWTKPASIAMRALAGNGEDLMHLAETVTAWGIGACLKARPSGLGGPFLVFAGDAMQSAAVSQALKAHGAYQTLKGLQDKETSLPRAVLIGEDKPVKSW
jgi:hypothetical protein